MLETISYVIKVPLYYFLYYLLIRYLFAYLFIFFSFSKFVKNTKSIVSISKKRFPFHSPSFFPLSPSSHLPPPDEKQKRKVPSSSFSYLPFSLSFPPFPLSPPFQRVWGCFDGSSGRDIPNKGNYSQKLTTTKTKIVKSSERRGRRKLFLSLSFFSLFLFFFPSFVQ